MQGGAKNLMATDGRKPGTGASAARLPLGEIVQGDVLDVLRGWPEGCVQLVLTSPPYWGLRDYQANGQSLAGQWGRESTPDEHVARMVALGRELRRVLRPDGVLVINYGEAYAAGGNGGHRRSETFHGHNDRPGDGTGVRKDAPHGLKPKDLLGMPWHIAQALQADGWWWRAWWPWVKMNGMPESCRDRPALSCEVMLMFTRSARYYWDQEAIRVGYAPASIERADGSQVTTGNPDVRPGFKRTLSKMPCGWDTGPGAHGGVGWEGRRKLSKAASSFARTVRNGESTGQKPQHRADREDVRYPAARQNYGRIRKTGDWHRESVALAAEQARAWADQAEHWLAHGGMLLDLEGLPLGQLHPTYAYPGSHFATYPPDLVRPIIRAATSERGQCPACGAPWVRVVEVGYSHDPSHANGSFPGDLVRGDAAASNGGRRGVQNMRLGRAKRESETTGWRPSCECDAGEPVPQVVCDPFAGTGTTCVVAAEEGRATVGIDLYGGNYDFGGHTAMDRLRAAMGTGAPLEQTAAERAGQVSLFDETGD